MKIRKRHVIAGAAVCVAAISALSIGFASWHTDITANGSVTASGKWSVEITDAKLSTSTGASTSKETTTYSLTRTGVKGDALIASVISAGTWVDDESLIGTQSDEAMSKYTNYYAVDTSKFDMSNISGMTKDDIAKITSDDSTLVISDHLKMYYRYLNPASSYDNKVSAACAEKVVDGLINDTFTLLQSFAPDKYQDYALYYLSASGGKFSYSIAAMESETESIPSDDEAVVINGAEANFADVSFGLPGAWAEYTITVANSGTVDASLADAVIELSTDSDQLELDKPDLSDETLKPGESCTVTFVVKVPDSVTGDLDASGALSVKLPYSQAAVEAAPSASHSHIS